MADIVMARAFCNDEVAYLAWETDGSLHTGIVAEIPCVINLFVGRINSTNIQPRSPGELLGGASYRQAYNKLSVFWCSGTVGERL